MSNQEWETKRQLENKRYTFKSFVFFKHEFNVLQMWPLEVRLRKMLSKFCFQSSTERRQKPNPTKQYENATKTVQFKQNRIERCYL